MSTRTCIAFAGQKRIAQGPILEVAARVKKHLQKSSADPVLIFDDLSSAAVEIDFRGTVDAVLRRLESEVEEDSAVTKPSGPGRPKLGVVSREISLLPRHWEWLSRQSGGASVTLRKLVEDAKKKNLAQDLQRQAQEATHKFMSAMAGNLPQFEEALRALYANNAKVFKELTNAWPKDIREHALKLSAGALQK